jgi:squalene-associated FAD-dependent desaturase
MNADRIVVVGGGLAGMAAALACADAGAPVTLLEARSRLGGATSSFVRDGLTLDTGQHVFLRCCTAYRGFLDRLGVTRLTSLQPRMDIPVLAPGRRAARLRRARLPAPLHLAPALLRYSRLGVRDRFRAARGALALRKVDPEDPDTDGQTFRQWLDRHGQSPAAVGALWNLFGLPALNLGADQASLAAAAMVFRTGLLERADAADIGMARVPLADLHGGPAALALSARGATIHTRAPVRGLRFDPKGPATVILDDGSVEGGAVILAVPHERAARLVPSGAVPGASRMADLGASPIVNVHLVYDRAVMDVPFAAAVGSPVQWVFDRTGPSGLASGQYLAVSLSSADELVGRPVAWFRQTFIPALADLFPKAREARVERFLVTREPAATFRQTPGTAALRPGPATRVPGLFLAGAWTDTGWPATMEGAVRSGLAAVGLALAATRERSRLSGVAT